MCLFFFGFLFLIYLLNKNCIFIYFFISIIIWFIGENVLFVVNFKFYFCLNFFKFLFVLFIGLCFLLKYLLYKNVKIMVKIFCNVFNE